MPARKTNYALCREPYADHAMRYVQTQGEPQELSDCAELNGKEGFVFAPFMPSADTPIVLIRPDKVEQLDLERPSCREWRCQVAAEEDDRVSYTHDFRRFHEALDVGMFDKLVLGRSSLIHLSGSVDEEELFWKACELYPRVYVALVSTTKSGTWLTATPEVLVRREGNACHTMALAGTMKLDTLQDGFDNPLGSGEEKEIAWSDKNREEQRIVATYIADRLKQLSTDIRESNAYTKRAGNLVHLRSDFTFTLPNGKGVGDVVKSLFPTPAVCGLPKAEAWTFIHQNESCDRRYYSGFIGSMMSEDDVRLYVTLRCMQIENNRLCLYAGGGLLADSDEEQEWNETLAKMETMKRLIYVQQ